MNPDSHCNLLSSKMDMTYWIPRTVTINNGSSRISDVLKNKIFHFQLTSKTTKIPEKNKL